MRQLRQVVHHLGKGGLGQLLGQVSFQHCMDETRKDAVTVSLIQHSYCTRVA